MTNSEFQSELLHWRIRSSSNIPALCKQHQDNYHVFHLPSKSIPMTYLQQNEQTLATYSKYVLNFCFNLRSNHILDNEKKIKVFIEQESSDKHFLFFSLRDEKMKSSDIILTGLLSSTSFDPILSQSNMNSSFHPFNNLSCRKRKQVLSTPSIPAKRSPSLTMFFSPSIPSNESIVKLINHNSKSIQTDPISSFTSSHQDILNEQNQLIVQINELRRTTIDIQCQYENTMDTIKRCLTITRSLLIDQSRLEKKQIRQTAMENRLRLGQFITQRHGMSFTEQWNDGIEFQEKKRAQEQLVRTRKTLNKDRKDLAKKKVFLQQQQHSIFDETKYSGSNSSDMNISSTSTKRMKKNLTINILTNSQKSIPLTNNTTFSFPNPFFIDHSNDSGSSSSSSSSSLLSPCSTSPMTLQDWYEYDEVLRLRQLTLKREENDLVQDLENLDRQRNIHIRELKRLYYEDHSRFNNNNILHDRYLLLTLIGKGGFSEVHRAFDLENQCYVACKIHQLNKEWKDEKKVNYIKHALREYDIHKHLEHKRIVKLFDVFEIDTNSFCTVLEYCNGNDLDFYLKQNKILPEKEARLIIIQIINALKYLNVEIKPPVIHYDLKPGNVLLGTDDHSCEIKITDFGLSKQMHEDVFDEDGMDLSSQGAGTYWYLPPEVFVQGLNPPKISSKVDVWSVGCIFYQCLYGRKPYGHNLSQAAVLENQIILNAKEVQFPVRPQVSNEAKGFIRRCLTYKVQDRPDVLQLSDDQYLKSSSSSSKRLPSLSTTCCRSK
ncbi:hypothetical protein I4U23_011993 [Adineta vaga]|nr:hypothetical protein I4U23_011993 [Adineta vaga]